MLGSPIFGNSNFYRLGEALAMAELGGVGPDTGVLEFSDKGLSIYPGMFPESPIPLN